MSRLFKIAASGQIWKFTDGDSVIVHLGDTYIPVYIQADEIILGQDIEKSTLNVRLSITNEAGQYLLKNFVEQEVSLTVFRNLAGGIKQVWKGSLFSVQPNDKGIQLSFETIRSILQKRGPRFRFQRMCPYSIYGVGCNKDKNVMAASLPVSSIAADGITLTVLGASGFADGYFDLGMVEMTDGTFRTIVRHSGNTITISYPSPAMKDVFPQGWGYHWGKSWGGQLVLRFFPGCNQTREVCNTRFSNLLNFGGTPEIPLENPTGKVF